MSRRLPGWSMIGVLQVLSALQMTVALVAAPDSSLSAKGVLRVAPVTLFQLAFATTPALSAALIAVALPTKSMLIAVGPAAFGTCIAHTRTRAISRTLDASTTERQAGRCKRRVVIARPTLHWLCRGGKIVSRRWRYSQTPPPEFFTTPQRPPRIVLI